MKKCLILTMLLLLAVFGFSQHEGIERHFDEYRFGDFATPANYYSGDTLLDCFHLFRQTDYQVYSTGCVGSANIPMFYHQQYQNHEFVFLTPYSPYISKLSGSTYFDTRTPFTRIMFIGGEKQLDNVFLVHSQNIRPWLNFGAEYKTMNTEGHYARQQAKNQSLNAFISVTKHRYNNHLNFIFNKAAHENSGGVESDEIFEAGSQRSENLGVKLNYASTEVAQTGISYYHELLTGTKLTDTIIQKNDTIIHATYQSKLIFSQSLSYNRYFRVYNDVPSGFYQNIYNDSTATYDSVGMRKFSHSFDAKYILRGKVDSFPQSVIVLGIYTDLLWYGQSGVYYDNSIYARWFSESQLITWNFINKIFVTGYHAGNVNSSLNLVFRPGLSRKHIISTDLNYSAETPDYFYCHYSSNNFKWDTDLTKTKQAKFSLEYNYVKWQIHAAIKYNYLDSFLYFDSNAIPRVTESNCNIFAAEIGKKLNLGKFHWYNQIRAQKLSDETYLSLPVFGAYSSLYFQSPLFKSKLILLIGVDATYFGNAKGYAYMPATGVFYMNTEKEYGNFLVFDFYASIKVKRFRAFAKLSHFNDVFMPVNYYGLLHYPADPMSFNFGISWEFYD